MPTEICSVEIKAQRLEDGLEEEEKAHFFSGNECRPSIFASHENGKTHPQEKPPVSARREGNNIGVWFLRRELSVKGGEEPGKANRLSGRGERRNE